MNQHEKDTKTIADLVETLRKIVELHDGDSSLVSKYTASIASMAIEKATGEVYVSKEFICDRCSLRQDAKPKVEPTF